MGKSQSKQLMVEPEDENYQRFAFVGFSGSGKSAFVNAVRGYVYNIIQISKTLILLKRAEINRWKLSNVAGLVNDVVHGQCKKKLIQ